MCFDVKRWGEEPLKNKKNARFRKITLLNLIPIVNK